MKIRMILSVAIGAVLTGMPAWASNCESLTGQRLKNTTIESARIVSKGAFTPPRQDRMRQRQNKAMFKSLPQFCRVQGVIRPSSDSHIEFEVWLPASDWNGRYRGVGNGGFAGYINYNDLAAALAKGYAAASTDTGHSETQDAAWALGHPEKVVDFGYRAIHETTVAAKSIVRSYYGSEPQYSYFSSCSNGGRQALMEAQRFPEDFDGIIAGAPAYCWADLMSMGVMIMQTFASEKSYIGAHKLPAIQRSALAECDALDRVRDGIIEDPTGCPYDPSKLLCRGKETDDCLTEPQLAALKKIYNGVNSSDRDLRFFGLSFGGEAEEGGWKNWLTGKESYTESAGYFFGTQFFQNMVYSNPKWDFRTFDLDRDAKAADDRLGSILNAGDPDLSKFKEKGGKLIIYHGWNDAAIPALAIVDYYKSVVSQMGQRKTKDFVRLFMVPGMQHCSGGAGADRFQEGDAEHNISAAIERWVEEGVPPDGIIATKTLKGSDRSGRIVRTRLLCPYPQTAKYEGSGSTDEAANFTCR